VTRKLPILPTVIVAAAVATMIGLGFWQIQRARWKEGLLAQYGAAERLPPVAWPVNELRDPPLFRRARGTCTDPTFGRTATGENAAGDAGYAFIADCGSGGSVAVGWSKNPNARIDWHGGPVSGMITSDPKTTIRLVADQAPPGLETLRPPSLDSIPNNHRFYAVQWFFFAAAALLIYALALRSKWTRRP
jgi:surfeit locus 1 family protein